ncbi:MAG: DUF2384 domain-containing protein [Gammaproteobacteria bacterium]|nr:DUF2384 domain-containing protein [Gammaproteobacteria bacterium]
MPAMTQDEERVALTQTIMGVLDEWGLDAADHVVAVVGLPDKMPKRNVRKFRDGVAFPDTPEVMEHLDHLVGIITSLRTTYPLNPQMGTHWMRRSNRLFGNRPPLQAMVEDGLDGLVAVRSHLDCTYDWKLDDERSGKL